MMKMTLSTRVRMRASEMSRYELSKSEMNNETKNILLVAFLSVLFFGLPTGRTISFLFVWLHDNQLTLTGKVISTGYFIPFLIRDVE